MDKTSILLAADRAIVRDPTYRKCLKRAVELHGRLERAYPGGKKHFDALCEMHTEMAVIGEDILIALLTNPTT
ncbi:MAG: hypothetical protein WD688_18150 [Candidatus Binatia bacterium]